MKEKFNDWHMAFSLLTSIELRIGGGTGWWCKGCGHNHKEIKPSICNNPVKTIDPEKLRPVVAELFPDIVTTLKRPSGKVILATSTHF